MLVRKGRGGGASRIDDDEAPAPLLQLAQAPPDAGRGHQASVRHHGVGAQHQQEVRMIDVGDRDLEDVAKEVEARRVLRVLVARARGVLVARREGAADCRHVGDSSEVVGARVPEVHAHRLVPVAKLDARQVRSHLVECLFPGDLLPAVRGPAKGTPHPVRIHLHLLEGDSLGTDVTAAHEIVIVGANPDDSIVLDLDEQAATRLTQIARLVDRTPGAHSALLSTRGESLRRDSARTRRSCTSSRAPDARTYREDDRHLHEATNVARVYANESGLLDLELRQPSLDLF